MPSLREEKSPDNEATSCGMHGKTVQDDKTEGTQANATNAEATDAVITLFQAGKYCQMVGCCGTKAGYTRNDCTTGVATDAQEQNAPELATQAMIAPKELVTEAEEQKDAKFEEGEVPKVATEAEEQKAPELVTQAVIAPKEIATSHKQ